MEIIAREHNLKETSDLEMATANIAHAIKIGSNPGIDKSHYKSKKIIFLPVNNSSSSTLSGSGGHWALLAYDVENQSFHYYDSSGSGN